MMKLSLQPTLTDLEKINLCSWLITTLSHEKFENGRNFPLPNRLALFGDNTTKIVTTGVWEDYDGRIHLAGSYDVSVIPLSDRLAILCTLAQYCDGSAELRDAMQKAITRYLLGEYQALSSNLVNAPVQPRGIAFSTTGGVASLFESRWITPSGESVDVSGEDWVVCASELPTPSSETVVLAADEFTRAESDSLAPVDTEWTNAIADTFVVGQRVRFTPANNSDESQSVGEGTITRGTLPHSSMYQVHIDGTPDEDFELAYLSELTPLPVATREFRVGDRVSYERIPGATNTPGTGEITRIANNSCISVRDNDGRTWSFTASELSHE